MDDETCLLQTDAARYRAMREGDLATLDALLADDLAYTHSSGSLPGDGRWCGTLAGQSISQCLDALRYHLADGSMGVVADSGRALSGHRY